jgi:hypothetical protein
MKTPAVRPACQKTTPPITEWSGFTGSHFGFVSQKARKLGSVSDHPVFQVSLSALVCTRHEKGVHAWAPSVRKYMTMDVTVFPVGGLMSTNFGPVSEPS